MIRNEVTIFVKAS